jgi:hypothetical protein
VKHVSSPFQMCRLLLVVAACLGMLGAEKLGYVKKAKYDALQKQLEKGEADLKGNSSRSSPTDLAASTKLTLL